MLDRMKVNNMILSPELVLLKVTEKILEKMKNTSLCIIENHGKGVDFF